ASQRGEQSRSVVIKRGRQLGVNRAGLLESLDAPFIKLAMIRPGFALLDQSDPGTNLQQDQFRELAPQGSLFGSRQIFKVRSRRHELPLDVEVGNHGRPCQLEASDQVISRPIVNGVQKQLRFLEVLVESQVIQTCPGSSAISQDQPA